jgi:disulfide oxidoreductase YuzD
MDRRYGGSAEIVYHDVSRDSVKAEYAKVVDEIESRGLLYPVTVIDGTPVYDGAVSYPAILRAVEQRLQKTGDPA